MELEPAAEAIGQALLALAPTAKFQHKRFPYPGFGDNINYAPGKPSIICRFDSIAEDKATENELIRCPSALAFEIRIVHQSKYPPSGVKDEYAYAQKKVLEGTSLFFTALVNNRHLNDLILDAGVQASFTGDLIDPTTQEELYGHQMIVITKVFR